MNTPAANPTRKKQYKDLYPEEQAFVLWQIGDLSYHYNPNKPPSEKNTRMMKATYALLSYYLKGELG